MSTKKLYFFLIIISSLFCSTGCSVGYLLKSSYHQQKILRARVPIKEVLKSDSYDQKTKQQLRLINNVKNFLEVELSLTQTDNYSTYVKLDRPYVTWIVRVSEAYNLKTYNWWFPIIGDVPYKGYFSKEGAEKEAKTFNKSKFDTYVRGVTAYSTLGWFDDPILSTMLAYKDHDLVELIIHESVHATLFIKNNVDFNERLATFIGQEGTKRYYSKHEGLDSKTILRIQQEQLDSDLFSVFITKELNILREWYKKNSDIQYIKKNKMKRLNNIVENFKTEVYPKLKTNAYKGFGKTPLNNAKLLSYETYLQDLSDFKILFNFHQQNFKDFLQVCKGLESSKNPQAELKKLISNSKL